MGMTERDRKVLAVVLVLIVLGGYWFLVVKKKQTAIQEAQAAQVQAQADLDAAKLAETQAKELAKVKPASYNKLVRLGKAVPTTDDFQSLLVQVNDVTDDNEVIFKSLTANKSAAGTVGSGSTTSCDAGGATGASGATPAPAPTPTPTASTGSTGGSTGATGSTGSTAKTGFGKARDGAQDAVQESDAANAAASCAEAPSLLDVTAQGAGLSKFDYSFTFEGSFYRLHSVFDDLLDLVKVRDGKVGVTGRLLDITQISLTVSSFPNLNAAVLMTGYAIPSGTNVADSAAAAAATATAATGTQATQ